MKNETKPDDGHTDPDTQPDKNTTKPDDDHTKPVKNDTKPEKNDTKPDDDHTKPVKNDTKPDDHTTPITPPKKNDTEVAVFAMGCFWCGEAAMAQIPGVIRVSSGYTGGKKQNPTYKQVCKGGTGHMEANEVVFNNTIISYKELLYYFWRNVDPTNGVGQFCDHGH